jgi:isoleucyl-tRNA synthetase
MKTNYKNTLLMPQTEFPMRGNLNQKEVEIEKYWEEIHLYKEVLKQNENNPHFILHDGPPYANGEIHIGHALNKILKDFVIRFHTMQGFYSPFIPGWDTHGLPIEIAVLKKFSKDRHTNRTEFLEECEKFTLFFVEKQKKNFKRLGILGDWDEPYITLNNAYVADQVRILGKMTEKKLIFKNLKPIYWSPYLKSSLAESEIIYKDKNSLSIFACFKIKENKKFQDVNLLIWTTTPWTLPANVAICVHPKKKYHLIKVNKKKYIIGSSVLEKLKKKFHWDNLIILDTFQGDNLENITYENVVFKRQGKIVLDTYVLDDEGTGLVHTANGHGYDDFLIGKKYNLDVICSVDKKGFMTDIAGPFKGVFYSKANELIVDALDKQGLLVKSEWITHSYPHDERIKKPVIFLAVEQWFLDIHQIKPKILEEITKIDWFPQWGQKKMTNMIANRNDWVISRQRMWGVPIPIFYAEDKLPILDAHLINHIADLFEKHGKEIWYKWDPKDLLPQGYTNKRSPNNIFTKEKDVLDVWFDSGTSYNVVKRLSQKFLPVNVYLEGSDQYRGWFNSSLTTSIAAFNKAPYQQVITHGFILDGKGVKMSKSFNNVVDPLTIVKQKGADVLRLWVSSISYNTDVRLDNSIVQQIEEKYRKIRNTLRFMLGNLQDFNPKANYIDFTQRSFIHQVIVLEFKEIFLQAIEYYETYDFEKIMSLLYPFISVRISAFYLDFTKDILYIEKENNLERRIIQSTIYDILIDLLKLLTPIIPHTTSEAYKTLSFKNKKDIYLEKMPTKQELKNFINHYFTENLKEAYKEFFILREIVLKKLEESRKNKLINKSLQAKLVLHLPKKYSDVLVVLGVDAKKLNQLFIVSQVEINKAEELNIEVQKASGSTCPRCWNVIKNKKKYDLLCKRCSNVMIK